MVKKERIIEDLVGRKFGSLRVEKLVSFGKSYRWKCVCDCGNIRYITTSRLKSGHNKSCGANCLLKATKNHPNFKGNDFIEKENYCVGFDSKNREFYIDKEDYEPVSEHCWTSQESNREALGGKYFSARLSRKDKRGNRMTMLQNFIWELHYGKIPNGYFVDHINLKPYDNRISNLRLANKSLNAFNCKRTHKSNTGIVGVTKISNEAKSNANKWRAYISFNGRRKELGYYNNKKEAIISRLKAEIYYFGEICPSNRQLYIKYKDEVNNE